MFEILVYFLHKNCNLPSKGSPPLSHQHPSKNKGPVKPTPLFENLVGGSTPQQKGEGCTLWMTSQILKSGFHKNKNLENETFFLQIKKIH